MNTYTNSPISIIEGNKNLTSYAKSSLYMNWKCYILVDSRTGK